MRRLLILGLLLLTACPDEEEPPPPSTKGKVQGKLSPFLGSSSVKPAARPPILQGKAGATLTQALQRAAAQQRLQQRKSALEVSDPGLPILPVPPGPPPLKRIPQTDPTII